MPAVGSGELFEMPADVHGGVWGQSAGEDPRPVQSGRRTGRWWILDDLRDQRAAAGSAAGEPGLARVAAGGLVTGGSGCSSNGEGKAAATTTSEQAWGMPRPVGETRGSEDGVEGPAGHRRRSLQVIDQQRGSNATSSPAEAQRSMQRSRPRTPAMIPSIRAARVVGDQPPGARGRRPALVRVPD